MRTLFELLAEGGAIRICESLSNKTEYVLVTNESYFDDESHFSQNGYKDWADVWNALTTNYTHWTNLYPGYIDPVYVDFVRKFYEAKAGYPNLSNHQEGAWYSALDYSRKQLVETALNWESTYGVMPSITSAVSEYDAARLIGVSGERITSAFQTQTAVTKGFDFIWNGVKYQIKANRPSGRKDSVVTMISKPKNYNWDSLIWILYDKNFNIMEVLLFSQKNFKDEFDTLKIIRPIHLRGSSFVKNLLTKNVIE